MALAAIFSAMEVVPLTLLTLDAWDFIKLSSGRCDICGKEISIPHKWTFYFMMSVGFWNFVGAGIFGFLINLPIVSYFEVGTLLTPNHGHAAMMGVFGMFAISFMVFAIRQVLPDEKWLLCGKICPALLLGAQYWPGPHGPLESFSRRNPPASRCFEERLLACPGPRVSE